MAIFRLSPSGLAAHLDDFFKQAVIANGSSRLSAYTAGCAAQNAPRALDGDQLLINTFDNRGGIANFGFADQLNAGALALLLQQRTNTLLFRVKIKRAK
ncbi:hypothetical protein C1H71_16160 [Iodobacter fluviatilis]|jgi:hypothetical protein|uniref:Uncharacterized protein n=1 Tax=Iodobacter fluviatilis TaxID=537 RepID=A0A7G3GE07_9NEIS|nr:hypothetical protein C1H71_16160 [Iodobacter fluviatilis]